MEPEVNASASVSVIIPTYNRLDYLKEAISSCLVANDVATAEVIVVDDGSTDGSHEWVMSVNDRRLRLIRQRHQGAPVARNAGLRSSTAPFVKFLDDDDVLEPGALAMQVAQIHTLSETEIPYGRVAWIDASGARIGQAQHRPRDGDEDPVTHLMENNIMTSAPLHRRPALLAVGGFDPSLDSGQEYELHLRLAATGYMFRYFEDVIYHQRHHRSPNRINSVNKLSIDPLHGMKRLDRVFAMLRAASAGKMKPQWLRHLARLYWGFGREVLRMGSKEVAEQYFNKARALAGWECLPNRWYYRVCARCLGPVCAERISSAWIRATKRQPISALDLPVER